MFNKFGRVRLNSDGGKPRHVEKFRKFRFADVGKNKLGKKEKETCAKHKIDRSQNGRSNYC